MSAEESRNTTPVTAPNGEPHPESSMTATPGKRKRSVQEERAGSDTNTSASHDKTNLHENLRNLVELLSK
jgi:hypothetical protein